MGLFTRIQNFFSQNKINFLYILSFIAVFFMLGDNAWADGTTGASPKTQEQQDLQSINLFFQMLAVILTLFTNLVGWFLSPEWTNGTLLGMDNMLKDLWLYVSNVVYFIFAMLFIWIALMNIIGKDGDNYKLKQAIPKFIVGVLIVPFSWFIVQFVISVSNILTTAVLSIPYNDFQGYMNDKDNKPFEVNVCANGYVVKTKTSKNANSETSESQPGKFTIECNSSEDNVAGSGTAPEPVPRSITKLLSQQNSSALGIMYVYTYSVMKIDNTDKLFSGELTSGLNDLMGIIFKYGFSLIILIAYALLLLALGFALFVRVVWLWFFAILSPIFGLLYFFDKKEGAGEGAMKNLSFTELISVALVPVYVSAALAFGFLFMKVASDGFGSGVSKNGNITTDCFTPIGIKEFRLCWDAPSIPKDQSGKTMFNGSIATILGQFFGLIFLWMAVMAALKSSNITKEVVQPIADFGASVGQIIQKGPANLPIIPVPDGKGGMTSMSAKGLANVGSSGANWIDQKSLERSGEFMKNNGLFGKGVQGTLAAKEAVTYMKNTQGLNNEMFDRYNKALKEFKTADDIHANSDAKEMVKILGERTKVKTEVGNPKEIAETIARIHNATYAGGLNNSTIFDREIIQENETTVESVLGGNSEETPKTPGTKIPSGVVRDGNKITINHFSNPPANFRPTEIQLGADNKVDIPKLTDALKNNDNGYKGVIKESELNSMLTQIGLTPEEIIDVKNNFKEFIPTPKP